MQVGDEGCHRVVQAFGYSSLYDVVLEYVQYPLAPEWVDVSGAAYSLLATLSAFDAVKGLVVHRNVHFYMMQTLKMS